MTINFKVPGANVNIFDDVLEAVKLKPKVEPSPYRGKLLDLIPEWMRMSPFQRKKDEAGLDSYDSKHTKGEDGYYRDADGNIYHQKLESVEIEDALLVSSQTEGGHYVILDIDMPVHVIPSSTPGKNHVYIDHVVTNDQMDKLLKVLVEVGLVNEGIYDLQWVPNKAVSLRLPWVKKGLDIPLSKMQPVEQAAVANGAPLPVLDGWSGTAIPPLDFHLKKPVVDPNADW